MSIYATLCCVKFPRYGEYHTGCEWIEIVAQGVPGPARTLGNLGRLAPGLIAPYTVLRGVAHNGSRGMGHGEGPALLPR
jgi:hypothetical protein